jgi:hypothetical protein
MKGFGEAWSTGEDGMVIDLVDDFDFDNYFN